MLMGNFITEERLFMEIRQGYSYHIKDEFFDLVQDKYLMSNKEQGNYRPHYYAIQEQPVTIHKKLDKLLVENLNEVLAMHNRGIKLTFTDITAIRTIMETYLFSNQEALTVEDCQGFFAKMLFIVCKTVCKR